MEQRGATTIGQTLASGSYSGEGSADDARRLVQFDQFIINGEVRIGRLTILTTAMTDRGISPVRVAALIEVFEGRLRRWNENRLRLIERGA
jgi:hypothetical protein